MNKLRHRNNGEIDLHGDIEKIKAALRDTTIDMRGKAREMINESLENLEERSALLKENVSDYVEKRPFKALGVAMLIGGVIGYLLKK